MSGESSMPSGVLLLGSIPLSSAEEVFNKIPAALPGRLFAIPDGETGIRDNYIRWQVDCFPKETIHQFLGGTDVPADHPGFTLDDIKPTRYDTVAFESYQTFLKLREQKVIPSGVRFQVSLPLPLNCVQGHTRAKFHAQLDPLYEQRMIESVQSIIQNIPAHDLALQWDVCFEVTALENERGRLTDPFFKPHFSPVMEGVLERIQRVSNINIIPAEIPLGFHLCYGDLGHKHFVEPEDLSLLVDLANNIHKRIHPRPITWVHMPVPKDRDDIAYFEPLKKLELSQHARLYLGVVHAHDEEGTRRRIQTAKSVVSDFGVATECGMGRTPAEELPSILEISRNVSSPVF
ncbi:hypothetical protein AnigIFM60653_003195 [Aspergillus niger]|uniref:Uncharacterized protein n=1 Tax=Aspergillus welwitschiae TaxID=1341132 RepID=A0A3F3QKD0_9EURO|nr:hypothetical protein BDQ94DRAFT_133115 [Aspergillus welwitschiae]RDH39460.1 hypothetical protein BDQ94DRAFT_133115 [Aspergillus welwitschiae]GKZ65740.1 hypothetical protein AnigIFM50267_009516 [Aspergillus niger]GLA03562.1 hypothetical protein AnigIFM60653_003195 [Aspergillus niger]GLA11781.1 hypothetical protein AnigIFM62618_005751 [Aspergillus niger]